MGVSSVANFVYLLLMKSLNKTETPILIPQCDLCFQRQSFGRLIYYTAVGVSAVWPTRDCLVTKVFGDDESKIRVLTVKHILFKH